MSKIGEILYISKPYVTSLVDKLADKGLVARHLHETDRRITNIALTDAGKEFLELHKKELGSQIGAKLVNLDQADLAELADSLLTMRKIMSHLTPK
jgi:DNA-binding MarR family transcriptional regulator